MISQILADDFTDHRLRKFHSHIPMLAPFVIENENFNALNIVNKRRYIIVMIIFYFEYIYIYIYIYIPLRKTKTGHIRIINLFPSCYGYWYESITPKITGFIHIYIYIYFFFLSAKRYLIYLSPYILLFYL